MDKNQESMERLFEGIYNFVAPMPENGREQKSFYTQFRAGIALSGFGQEDAALMADNIPAVQKDYANTGKVSDVYSKILGAVLPFDHPSEDEREVYEKAKALVAGGSREYAEYKLARKAYEKAYRAYCRLLNDSGADEYDIMEAKQDKDEAYTDFVAAGKSEIENALNIVSAYESFTPQAVFNGARADFQKAQAEKGLKGGMPTLFFPDKWADAEKLAWESITVQTSSQTFTISNEAKGTSFSSLDEISAGWWIFGSKNKATRQEVEEIKAVNSKMTTGDLSVSMDLAVIEVERPWFDAALLSYSEAYLKNEDAGAVCSGALTGNGIMQLVPSAFVLVRNVRIYNRFSEEEKKVINTITDRFSDNLSYGPFKVWNSWKSTAFHDKISQTEQDKFGDVSCLSLEEPQIIGVISTVASPKFPAVSGKGK